MATSEIKLTRNQIKEIVGEDLRKVKVFENIISVVSTIINANLGSFIRTSDQTVAVADTAYAVEYDTVEESNNIEVVSNSQLTVGRTGTYLIDYSLSLALNIGTFYSWIRVNGVDVDNTGIKHVAVANGEQVVLQQNLRYNLAIDDYIEIMYASSITSNVINYDAATAFSPASPASRVTIRQIT